MDDPIHASQPVRMRGLDYVGDREDDTSESDTHREPGSTFVLTAHNVARAPGKLLQILSSSRRRIRGSDIERPSTFTNNPPQKAPRGFPAVAEFIAQDPDQETYIFRKFNRLTAWNLVVLQNQLTDLDSQLKDAEAAARRDPEAVITLRNWETFSEKAKYDGQSLQAEIAKLSEDVRLKLQEYHTALHLASTIAHLPQPGHRILKVFRTGLKGMRAGSLTEAFLDESNEADLVALNGSSETDLFTRFMRWAWPVVLTEGPKSKASYDEARYFKDGTVKFVTRVTSVLLAALLLVASILALYFETGDAERLGLLLMFIVLFAAGVALTTNANKDSIFASTAAYAAVLIVFISGDLGSAASSSSSSAAGNSLAMASAT